VRRPLINDLTGLKNLCATVALPQRGRTLQTSFFVFRPKTGDLSHLTIHLNRKEVCARKRGEKKKAELVADPVVLYHTKCKPNLLYLLTVLYLYFRFRFEKEPVVLSASPHVFLEPVWIAPTSMNVQITMAEVSAFNKAWAVFY